MESQLVRCEEKVDANTTAVAGLASKVETLTVSVKELTATFKESGPHLALEPMTDITRMGLIAQILRNPAALHLFYAAITLVMFIAVLSVLSGRPANDITPGLSKPPESGK